MKNLFREHKGFWNKRNKASLYTGILFLAVSLVMNFFAGRYSAKSATNFVGDLFLDNMPTINFDYIIVEGAFLAIIASIVLLILKPRYLLFSLKAVAIFNITRSFFVSLTHIGIYPQQIILGDSPIERLYMFLNLQDGFFFSAHTGMPLLMALIVWHDKFWRYFFIAASALFAVAVLFAHVHYSIDVFAAPFMTYGVFKIARALFRKDYALVRDKFDNQMLSDKI
ncbi:MAG: hypothetical protein HY433_01435 [Candidatus Liptonbacteria bacterium]|nr:hypothetical protein [Candidatus Liptonbacteria bacterium]